MTITFPRDYLYPLPFKAAVFDPLYFNSQAPTRGSRQQVAEVAPAVWQMRFESYPLREVDAEAWKAWLHSLRGGLRLFKAWNPVREFAICYSSGYGSLARPSGESFEDGTANLSAIATARDEITITTLPPDFVFSVGDMVSIPFSSSRSLHRVVEAAIASEAGSVTVGVEPTLPLGITTSTTIDLRRPHCLAVLDPASVSGPWQVGRRAPIIFSAVSGY